MSASLVGSEMCIRDRLLRPLDQFGGACAVVREDTGFTGWAARGSGEGSCLLYTSDAADDM
eukprot:6523663-Alexandrium_andersonii.AAC.1